MHSKEIQGITVEKVQKCKKLLLFASIKKARDNTENAIFNLCEALDKQRRILCKINVKKKTFFLLIFLFIN